MASEFKPAVFHNIGGSKITIRFPSATTKFDSARSMRQRRIRFKEKLWSGRGHPTDPFYYRYHAHVHHKDSARDEKIFKNSKFAVTQNGKFVARWARDAGVEFCTEDSDGNIDFAFHHRTPHLWSGHHAGREFYFKKSLDYDQMFSNRIIL